MTRDLSSASFREALLAMVRRTVPERDAEDLVQAVLAEAIGSSSRPDEPEAMRRWIWGVARHKIADYYRRTRREQLEDPEPRMTPAPANDAAVDDLLRWAVGELPPGADARRTFEWLLREGEGEKLEDIARSEQLPATQVRQRVSRLRRHFRARWAAYAAAAGIVAAVVVYFISRRAVPRPVIEPAPDAMIARARRVRALRDCDQARWVACLAGLDEARAIDPAGENAPEVRQARQRARDALRDGETQAPDATSAAPRGPVETAPVPVVPSSTSSSSSSTTTTRAAPRATTSSEPPADTPPPDLSSEDPFGSLGSSRTTSDAGRGRRRARGGSSGWPREWGPMVP